MGPVSETARSAKKYLPTRTHYFNRSRHQFVHVDTLSQNGDTASHHASFVTSRPASILRRRGAYARLTPLLGPWLILNAAFRWTSQPFDASSPLVTSHHQTPTMQRIQRPLNRAQAQAMPVPNELLYDILRRRILEDIHDICMPIRLRDPDYKRFIAVLHVSRVVRASGVYIISTVCNIRVSQSPTSFAA